MKNKRRKVWNVQADELTSPAGIASCYERAVKLGVIRQSELNALQFFTAALSVQRRVKPGQGDPARIFASNVRTGARTGHWPNMSNKDEEAALKAIAALRSDENVTKKKEIKANEFPGTLRGQRPRKTEQEAKLQEAIACVGNGPRGEESEKPADVIRQVGLKEYLRRTGLKR